MDNKPEEKKEKVPLGQIVFDEIFLLFLLSLIISLAIYNIWGMMEITRLPVFTP